MRTADMIGRNSNESGLPRNAGIGQTLLNDLRQGDFNLRRDFKDIYDFYLDDEARRRVAGMGRLKRWLFIGFWISKSLFLKLTPARRILLLVALILGVQVNEKFHIVAGMLVLLLILFLELKDKLLAQDELAAGRAVQFALMPERSPRIPGWDVWLFTRPANDVGGDLVDCLRIQEDRTGLALGDVSGKGLGAALVMARLQSTLRALAPGFDSVADLGVQMNRIFCRDAIRSSFASLTYLEISENSGRIRILNAGHMPAFAVRNGSVVSMPRGGPALGVLLNSSYVEQGTELEPGDLFVVYSDGITEASNVQSEFFGVERLEKLLPDLRLMPAEQAGARVLSEVDRFVGSAKPHDDISLLIMRRLSL